LRPAVACISGWSDCRARYRHKGEWLFGDFSLTDIMFVPVALRFLSYGIPISDSAAEFQRAVVAQPLVSEWVAAAKEEVEAIGFIDDLAPAAGSPLTLG
jgi:glutathione S-transferase